MPVTIFETWARACLPEGRTMVLEVLKRGKPLSNREIYDTTIQMRPRAPITPPRFGGMALGSIPSPPNPEHPIRSMSFLKHAILPSLERTNQIEKFHTVLTMDAKQLADKLARMNTTSKTARKAKRRKEASIVAKVEGHKVHTWLWRVKEAPEMVPPKEEEKPDAIAEAVGAKQDISHLNNRRQRSRQESIERDLRWAHKLEDARLHAVSGAQEEIRRHTRRV